MLAFPISKGFATLWVSIQVPDRLLVRSLVANRLCNLLRVKWVKKDVYAVPWEWSSTVSDSLATLHQDWTTGPSLNLVQTAPPSEGLSGTQGSDPSCEKAMKNKLKRLFINSYNICVKHLDLTQIDLCALQPGFIWVFSPTFTVRVSSRGSRTKKWNASSHRGDVDLSQIFEKNQRKRLQLSTMFAH